MQLSRSTLRYRPRPSVNEAVSARIREIAATRIRYGYWRIYVLLQREGWRVNHKRVHRLYVLAGLTLRSKRPRRNRAGAHRTERVVASRPNQSWSMPGPLPARFVSDALFDGRRFRALTIVDNFSRHCLAIHADASIRGSDVVDVVTRICAARGQAPERIQVDNGSEFISQALDRWAYDHGVTLDFSRPGKPTDNAYIESFNPPASAGREPPRRVPERALVLVARRRPYEDRSLAEGVQRLPTAPVVG